MPATGAVSGLEYKGMADAACVNFHEEIELRRFLEKRQKLSKQ